MTAGAPASGRRHAGAVETATMGEEFRRACGRSAFGCAELGPAEPSGSTTLRAALVHRRTAIGLLRAHDWILLGRTPSSAPTAHLGSMPGCRMWSALSISTPSTIRRRVRAARAGVGSPGRRGHPPTFAKQALHHAAGDGLVGPGALRVGRPSRDDDDRRADDSGVVGEPERPEQVGQEVDGGDAISQRAEPHEH